MTFVYKNHGQFDHLYNDAAETIIVTPIDEDGTEQTERQNARGVREPIDVVQITEFAAIGLEPGSSTWRIWSSTLNGYTPKNGDKIKDSDGQFWQVLAVTKRHTEPRFVCLCNTRY